MPWVNLSKEEIEELRTKKHTLTEYGRQQLRKLREQIPADDVIEEMLNVKLTDEKKQELKEMRKNELIQAKVSNEDFQKILNLMNNQEPYPDEMLSAVEVAHKEREKEEWERKVRNERILIRYNEYHNLETSGLPHGTPITPEQQQMIAFRAMIDAFKCDHLNQEYTHIAIDDIEDLIEGLYQQSIAFLDRVKKSRYNTNDT